MIIYLDEDAAYLSWVNRHRDGFVLEWLRQPAKRRAILHRASCPQIRLNKWKSPATHWTTGRRLKACARRLDELVRWCETESGHQPLNCMECLPQENSATLPPADLAPISKLGREILDHVVDVAVIHLDNVDSSYRLKVGDVALCLEKTTNQIATALLRLLHSGNVVLNDDVECEQDLRASHLVFPTARALQMLPAFQATSLEEVQQELSLLRDSGSDSN